PAVGGAVLQAQNRQAADRVVRVAHRQLVEAWPGAGRVARMIRRERAQRRQGRAARARALVLEPAPEQLELLAEAELGDRSIGKPTDAVVAAAGGGLDLVVPARPQLGKLALRSRRAGKLLGARRGLGELHQTAESERDAGPTYRAEGLKRRPVRFCSRMCAAQQATREQANIAGASGGGISATSSTIAE